MGNIQFCQGKIVFRNGKIAFGRNCCCYHCLQCVCDKTLPLYVKLPAITGTPECCGDWDEWMEVPPWGVSGTVCYWARSTARGHSMPCNGDGFTYGVREIIIGLVVQPTWFRVNVVLHVTSSSPSVETSIAWRKTIYPDLHQPFDCTTIGSIPYSDMSGSVGFGSCHVVGPYGDALVTTTLP